MFIFMIMIYDLLRKYFGKVRKVMKIYDFFSSGKVRIFIKRNKKSLGKVREVMKINEESYEKN